MRHMYDSALREEEIGGVADRKLKVCWGRILRNMYM